MRMMIDKLLPPSKRLWIILFFIWMIFGIINSYKSYHFDYGNNAEVMGWERVYLFTTLFWLYWFFITPVIIYLTKKFPLSQKNFLRNFSIHLLGSILVVLFHQFITGILCNVILVIYYLPVFDKWLYRLTHLDSSIFGILIYWVILGSYLAIDYYRKLQKEELRNLKLEKRLAETQLKALKMQLHPHFLFNVLNSISTLILSGDNKSANKMLTMLSDFLRMTIEEKGVSKIPLHQEIAFIKKYLDMQMIRFSDKLDIKMEFDESLMNTPVPNFILQPIVENAIHHAIMPFNKQGILTLKTFRANGDLILQVEDNGPGIKNLSSEITKGIGIKNTRERLEQLYGEKRFEFKNKSEGGLSVSLRIPIEIISLSDSIIPDFSHAN